MSKLKTGILYTGGFLLLYVLFVVVLAPANKLIALIELPQGIALHDVQGSVWSGRAKTMSTQNYEVDNVDWRLSPVSLLTGSPSADVEFGRSPKSGPTGNLTIANEQSHVGFSDGKIQIDAAQVLSLLTLPVDMQASGLVTVDINKFTTGKQLCSEVDGQIRWQQAGIMAMNENIALGEFNGLLSCENNSLAITLDPNNDLGLELSIYIRERGRIAAQGYITPGEKFPAQARPILDFLGPKDAQGRYRIRI
ncbi:type II secretion system protein N [Thalassotalea mangrovi]|uniref:Type II secretion system protein N n=1 Tax=Thalassotalea mangrovi TaxID=2572245 RepID=A0A4V5NUK1_9GAMM|nr:type II secretion system protein N [Thalassotalea mangrovi]TKB46685.1 type II secretion system protein N [Thalassotalea mangrovi]